MMTGFEPPTSGIGSKRSTNLAKTTAQIKFSLFLLSAWSELNYFSAKS